MKKRVIVISGGPAGMMAAGCAAEKGAEVILLERNACLGKKLAITGKGRCNITNVAPLEQFMRNYAHNGKFLYSALSNFSNYDTISFFNDRGVALKEERGGRVFPASDRAGEIVKVMHDYIRNSGVRIREGIRAKHLKVEDGCIKEVYTFEGDIYSADAVILATGGLSYPLTGSTGDGYKMAAALGHTIVSPKAALVPLETDEWVQEMAGLSLRNVEAKVTLGGTVLAKEFGEMLFTHFGVSGPIVLSISSQISEQLEQKVQGMLFHINLKPALEEKQLDARVQRDFSSKIRKQFKNAFDDLLPKTLIPVFVERSGIDPEKPVHQITKEERLKVVRLLQDFSIRIKGPRPIEEAIVTAGGVSVKEINPATMESKLIKGLFFAGEIIDVDGYTGGYNLQAAFSTGYLAGQMSAR